jgi:flagellar L-ring protein precursor FlgH
MFSGCAITPSTIVKEPTTAKAAVPATVTTSNGAIFSASTYRPTFEDRRPRFVGDIVTINIIENTSATKANASSGSKEGDASFNTDAKIGDNTRPIGGLLAGLPFGNLASFSASSDNSFADKAAANSSNVFTGSITTTVVEVLPNGNLIVSGEKQVALDKGTEFVRFSGVVNPDTITQGNFVPSTKVADARIEYRTNSKIDGAAIASIFARFFLSMSPW